MRLAGPLQVAVTLLAALSAAGAQAGGKEFDLGSAGKLWLPVPATWSVGPGERVGPFPTWEIAPPGSGGAVLLVTPTYGTSAQATPLREALRAEAARDQEVEERVAKALGKPEPEAPEMFLQQGPEALVAWLARTDPSDTPAPGDYAHLVRALVDVGELRLSCTLLHHEPDPELVEASLWLLANARHDRPKIAHGEQRLRLGERDWVLVLPVAGFELDPPMMREDGGGIAIRGTHPQTELVFSAFVERTERRQDASAWRDEQLAQVRESPLPTSGLLQGEIGGKPALQYDVKRALGQRLDQRHVNVYLVRDDCWIDVHVSRVGFRKGDEQLITDFLAGVQIEDLGAAAVR